MIFMSQLVISNTSHTSTEASCKVSVKTKIQLLVNTLEKKGLDFGTSKKFSKTFILDAIMTLFFQV